MIPFQPKGKQGALLKYKAEAPEEDCGAGLVGLVVWGEVYRLD